MKFQNSAILGFLLAILVVAAAVISQAGDIPILLVLAGLVAIGLCAYLVVRIPQVFLVAAAFAPQWKGYWPLSSVDRVADLTLVMLGCVALAIVWRISKHLSRVDPLGLNHLFYGQGRIILAFFLFAAIMAFSLTYTLAPEYGATKVFRVLGIGTLLFLAPLFLIRNEEEFQRFMRIFLVFAGVTVVQLVGGLQAPNAVGDVTRIGAGWIVGMAAVIVLFYPLVKSESQQRLLLIFGLPILVLGLIASVARGPMVALFLILMIRLIDWFKEGKRSLAIALAGVFAISGAGAFLFVRGAGHNKYTNKANELIRLVEGEDNKGSAATRVLFYQAALPAIPDHLFLGRGVGSWSVFYFGKDERAYPHNMLVEVTFEEGLLGLAALVFLFGSVYAHLKWLSRETHSYYAVLSFLILYCLTVAMFSGDLDDNRMVWLWFGMTMAVCRNLMLEQAARASRVASSRFVAVSRVLTRPTWIHS